VKRPIREQIGIWLSDGISGTAKNAQERDCGKAGFHFDSGGLTVKVAGQNTTNGDFEQTAAQKP